MKRQVISIKNLIIIALFFIVGCATAPTPRPQLVENSQKIHMGFEKVWNNLIEYLSAKQAPFGLVNKESGLIDLRETKISGASLPDYIWTGKKLPSIAYPYGTVVANILVQRISDNQTRVTVNATAKVYHNFPPNSAGWESAESTGKFEQQILMAAAGNK